jgi:hypothetical protein
MRCGYKGVRAVEVAATLRGMFGQDAATHARARRDRACAARQIARADLYVAVCVILEDRVTFFSERTVAPTV